VRKKFGQKNTAVSQAVQPASPASSNSKNCSKNNIVLKPLAPYVKLKRDGGV